MNQPKRKRNRGVVLTAKGLEKLQKAKLTWEERDNYGEKYTYEEISELTHLDVNTVRRILDRKSGVDRRSLEKFYRAFKLQLDDEFFTKPKLERRQNWGEAVSVEYFFERTNELKLLTGWLLKERCRLITLLGMGGIGKTTLSIKLAQQVSSEFDVVVWKSLRDAPPVSETVGYLIEFLSKGKETQANLPSRLGEKISRLIAYLRAERCLIIFDNIESLMNSDRAGKYRPEDKGYGELIRRIGATEHDSCLILTTREKPQEVAVLEGDFLPVRCLQLQGLKQAAELFQVKGLTGSDRELERLSDRYDGNPLALKVVAATIKDLFAGSVTEFLAQKQAIFGDIRDLLDEQFARLSSLEQEIMLWIAIAREPVSQNQLKDDLVEKVSPIKFLEALESLSRRSLIEKNETSFTQQSVVMEYLTNFLVEGVSQEIITDRPQLLASHALIKATTKDYVRENQIRLILQPIIDELWSVCRNKSKIEQCLSQILRNLQRTSPPQPSYGAGNIINLLCHLETDLTGYDFSNLCVWQADLRQAQLHRVNFQNADLAKTVFAENFGGVWSVAFSPDGAYLAAGDTKGNILLRRVVDGQPIRSYTGHSAWVVSLAFSPDGRTLASGSCDSTAKLWDVNTGLCLHSLESHEHEVWSVAFSPDGATLVTGCDDSKARLWDVNTGQCIQMFQGHRECVLAVQFDSDGRKLFTAGDDCTIKLWDIATEKCIRVFEGHEDGVRSISLSPDGKTIVSGSNDKTLRLWDIKTSQCLQIFTGHLNAVLAVAFSPQGNLLASSSIGHKIRLWSVETGECVKILLGHSNIVNSIAFTPTGETLASGSYDQSIKLWNIDTYQCLKTWQGYSRQTLSIVFSSDENTFVSGGHDAKVRLWDLTTEKVVKTFEEHTNWVFSVAFDLNHGLIASSSADKSIKIWDINAEKSLQTMWGHDAVVRSVVFSPDGTIVASGSEDETIRLWDVRSGRELTTLQKHEGEIWSIAFSYDGNNIASASFDETVIIWDVETGKPLKTFRHSSWVFAVAFSPIDNILASTSPDQTIKLWDIDRGECIRSIKEDIGYSQSVSFSNDGRIIASCNGEHQIRLWQTSTGKCLNNLCGHTALVTSIIFSRDNQTLISSSEDETIKLWDIQTGKCMKSLRSDNPYEETNIKKVTGLAKTVVTTLKWLGACD